MRRAGRAGAAGALLALAAAGGGCGATPARDGEGAEPPSGTEGSRLLADGTVPWTGERADERAFRTPPARGRPEAPGAAPCRSAQLRGKVAGWQRKLLRDDFGKVLEDTGLRATVRVRNASPDVCRLQGEVPAALHVDGRPLGTRRSHGIDDAGRRRTTTMRPGQEAELRLDWSSPFCGEARGRQVVVLELPGGGGVLRAPVRRAAQPPCFSDDLHPERRSVLSAGAFDEPVRQTPLDSPLRVLRARVEPGRPVAAGRRMTYHVVLVNPTRRAVALRPCPGYLESRYSTARPGHDDAVNDSEVFRLNCRPVRTVPARGSVRFQMALRIPDGMAPGRRLSVAWQLLAPKLGHAPALQVRFTVVVP